MTALLWPATALLMTAMVTFAALTAWRGWLSLKRLELLARGDEPGTGARIELAAIRERLRKLEAIAQGVDL